MQESHWSETIREKALVLIPWPNSGFFWRDAFYIILLASIQFSVFNSIISPHVSFDLITPWLVVICVGESLPISLGLGMIAAGLMESSSAIPAGTYFTIYLIMISLLQLIKGHLSWYNHSTWRVTMFCAQGWVCLFELTVAYLRAPLGLDTPQLLTHLTAFFISPLFGIWLGTKWLNSLEYKEKQT